MFTICLHIDLKKGSSHVKFSCPSVKQVPSSFHYQTLSQNNIVSLVQLKLQAQMLRNVFFALKLNKCWG
jgi:hypothetical protein